MDEEARRQTMAGMDDFGPIEIPEMENESTFMMAPADSPTRDQTVTEGLEAQDEDPPQVEDYDDDGNEPFDIPGLQDEDDVDDDNNQELLETTIVSQAADLPAHRARRKKAGKKISRHGIEYPSLPQGVVKRLATTLAKTAGVGKAKISADTLDSLMQATDWFFEQLGDDLSAYAQHAGRKTIDESDMVMLMRRYVTFVFTSKGILKLKMYKYLIIYIQTTTNEYFHYAVCPGATALAERTFARIAYGSPTEKDLSEKTVTASRGRS